MIARLVELRRASLLLATEPTHNHAQACCIRAPDCVLEWLLATDLLRDDGLYLRDCALGRALAHPGVAASQG